MPTVKPYKTKQRAVVEECLKQNKGRHLTAEDIAEMLHIKGENVGRTTVYRTLEKLEQAGVVRRYAPVDGTSACYQYCENGDVCHEHFHLKCNVCGKLYHIECSHMDTLSEHINCEHGFKVDKLKTVLYGVCEECSKK